MKMIYFFVLTFSLSLNAAEIVDVRNQIPMTNDAPRIKDYYISTDGVNLKKDLVVKIIRNMSVSQGKKKIGDVKVEIGQLRILAVADKVAVAREYKIYPKDQTPLTEAIGFMIGDQVNTEGSFLDNSKRKPNAEEAAATTLPTEQEAQTVREPSSEQLVTPDAHAETQKIEVKIFPDKI